ncbi:hypothetical protein F4604DRAFT_1954016 [Suillus subluteus]|nr:hypothetical protein F4604DRAFT_1954016 [Suillus subluteus]
MADASPSSMKVEQAKAHSWCILIDGQGIRVTMLSSLRRAIGVVPQGPVLFNANIGYNIAYGQPSITPPDESTIISSEN